MPNLDATKSSADPLRSPTAAQSDALPSTPPSLNSTISRATLCGIRAELLSDESMKLMNLCHEWLHCYLPFALSKIHRVSMGVLSDEEVRAALKVDPKMPKSRTVTAVPFVSPACTDREDCSRVVLLTLTSLRALSSVLFLRSAKTCHQPRANSGQ